MILANSVYKEVKDVECTCGKVHSRNSILSKLRGPGNVPTCTKCGFVLFNKTIKERMADKEQERLDEAKKLREGHAQKDAYREEREQVRLKFKAMHVIAD